MEAIAVGSGTILVTAYQADLISRLRRLRADMWTLGGRVSDAILETHQITEDIVATARAASDHFRDLAARFSAATARAWLGDTDRGRGRTLGGNGYAPTDRWHALADEVHALEERLSVHPEAREEYLTAKVLAFDLAVEVGRMEAERAVAGAGPVSAPVAEEATNRSLGDNT